MWQSNKFRRYAACGNQLRTSLDWTDPWIKVLRVTQAEHHVEQARSGVAATAAAISGMALLLVAGLSLLDIPQSLGRMIAGWVDCGGNESFPNHLPPGLVWLVAVLVSFGLASAMLAVSCHWQRWVLGVSSLVLMAMWAPVLALAAYVPDVGVPWIATAWAAVSAMAVALRQHGKIEVMKNPTDEES